MEGICGGLLGLGSRSLRMQTCWRLVASSTIARKGAGSSCHRSGIEDIHLDTVSVVRRSDRRLGRAAPRPRRQEAQQSVLVLRQNPHQVCRRRVPQVDVEFRDSSLDLPRRFAVKERDVHTMHLVRWDFWVLASWSGGDLLSGACSEHLPFR